MGRLIKPGDAAMPARCDAEIHAEIVADMERELNERGKYGDLLRLLADAGDDLAQQALHSTTVNRTVAA
jgi:hypothetical protein